MSESDDGGGCTVAAAVLWLVTAGVGGRREERWHEGEGERERERERERRGKKRNR